ncbi:MAG: hypothetical protein JWQ96_1034 [Segetibacter sp.]|nr:hypothetical protein [Segetibacter sp.]
MKATLIVFFVCLGILSEAQTTTRKKSEIKKQVTSTSRRTNTRTIKKHAPPVLKRVDSAGTTTQKIQPRPSITESRLNGNRNNNSGANQNATTPFAGGIHAAPTAGERFDTLKNTTTNTVSAEAVTVAGGNDTTFNINSINQNGVTTTSGAVDRSGQSQFGQTNWGRNNRNTIGESQWTVPPPITATFNKEFPAVNGQWSRSVTDTSTYAVRYQQGAQWVTSTYNATGQRLDMRTEIPLLQAPRPVSVFTAKQPQGFQISSISKLQIQGRPDVFEIRSGNGRTYYINNDGIEVKF